MRRHDFYGSVSIDEHDPRLPDPRIPDFGDDKTPEDSEQMIRTHKKSLTVKRSEFKELVDEDWTLKVMCNRKHGFMDVTFEKGEFLKHMRICSSWLEEFGVDQSHAALKNFTSQLHGKERQRHIRQQCCCH